MCMRISQDEFCPGRTTSFNKKMNTTYQDESLTREAIVIDTLKTSPVFNSLLPVRVSFPFSDSMFSIRPKFNASGYIVD